MVSCPAQEDVRAEDVGLDELGAAQDRTVDMRLGREVHDGVAACSCVADRDRVGDVALVELVRHAFEVRPVARVRELVEDDRVVAPRREEPHEVRADEAGAAGDEDPHAESLARQARRPFAPVRQARRLRLLRAQDGVRRPRRRAASSSVVTRRTRQSIPASSKIASANSAHVQSPSAATWYVP